jgi:hypothetical protein
VWQRIFATLGRLARPTRTEREWTMRRRAQNTLRRLQRSAVVGGRKVQTNLGELVAAAFDTVGNEVKDVAKLLASPELGRAAHSRIVLVQ